MKLEESPPPLPEVGLPEQPVEGTIEKQEEKSEKAEEVVLSASSLQKRQSVIPQKLSPREASKTFLGDERKELAREIYNERAENRNKILELESHLEILRADLFSAEINWDSNQKKYQELVQLRAEQVDSFAGRIRSALNAVGLEFESDKELQKNIKNLEACIESSSKEKEALKEEIDNLGSILESDAAIKGIKNRLSEHYSRAGEISQERFEQQQRQVENAIMRNNVFILHTLTTEEKLRHNSNSPISKVASLEDDIDIALSLEPPLSSSSVPPGHKKGLFQEDFGAVGLIIGGGEIQFAAHCDAGTRPDSSITKRERARSSIEKIDEVLTEYPDGGYNELVVNSPKIFGLFKSVSPGEAIEENGQFRHGKTADFRNKFREHMDLARKKGLPQFILTPDRRIFEYISIDDSNMVRVGKEIHPVDVASGDAGLPIEDRRALGAEVVSRCLFRNVEHQIEAKNIVAGLKGEKSRSLSKEEYIENLQKYPDEIEARLYHYPESLLTDKSFMMDVARINPEVAMRIASRLVGEQISGDPEFIKYVYSLIPADRKNIDIFHLVPIKNRTKELAILAIERDDILSIGALTEELFNDEEIRNKFIQRKVDKFNIRPFEHKEVAGYYPSILYTNSQGKVERYNLNKDSEFMKKLKDKYRGIYEIEPLYEDDILIKKINP